MIRKVLLCCGTADVLLHKRSALPVVLEHVEHEVEAVSATALQCLAVLSQAIDDRVQAICNQLYLLATTSLSELIR